MLLYRRRMSVEQGGLPVEPSLEIGAKNGPVQPHPTTLRPIWALLQTPLHRYEVSFIDSNGESGLFFLSASGAWGSMAILKKISTWPAPVLTSFVSYILCLPVVYLLTPRTQHAPQQDLHWRGGSVVSNDPTKRPRQPYSCWSRHVSTDT